LCVIDNLSYLKKGYVPKQTGVNYEDIVKDFLNVGKNKYNAEWLWSLRNGLVHDYGESDKMKKEKTPKFFLNHTDKYCHLSFNKNVYTLHVQSFATDVGWCTKTFFDDANSVERETVRKGEVEKNGETLLTIFITGEEYKKSIKSRSYKSMHPSLKELDKSLPDYNKLFSDIKGILADKEN
jgi:hypothetical protein